ncbi:MAG: B12-binding domain-containing protein [Deltaproteobacteria bacterium]|jgi:corrinoid protein of di/trimethylamine methyltransferase|nr:B12-binding domain-containing protein [Deltaproteobacteria bacterium]
MGTILEEIISATVDGDEEKSVALARQAMADGMEPFEVIQNGYARGMKIVGEKFATLEYFLPEVMLSADAMTAAIEVLKPYLKDRGKQDSRGTIVIATIQGDMHDLGKNIVKIMLEADGFVVHDLGANVPVRDLIDKAEAVQADIIAASAILTTTMAHMPDISSILDELGMRDRYMIMLGGAPVIPQWAREVGADGYGEDASEAVAVARRLMHKKRGGE